MVCAERIGVEVKVGVVARAGQAGSFAEAWAAESAARRIAGVKARSVAINVKLPTQGQRGDIPEAGGRRCLARPGRRDGRQQPERDQAVRNGVDPITLAC